MPHIGVLWCIMDGRRSYWATVVHCEWALHPIEREGGYWALAHHINLHQTSLMHGS